MDFEISNLNTLNHLQDRVVRGAKPGAYNSRESGKVYVTTDSSSDTAVVKDYLLQPAIPSNTIHGTASFTVGSKHVTTTGSFSGLVAGDSIRMDGEHTTYGISSIVSSTELILSSSFQLDRSSAPGSVATGTYTATRVLFGSLFYDSVENTPSNPSSFVYNSDKGRWEEAPGVPHSTPFGTDTTVFKDGISLNFVGRKASPVPDLQGVGEISKVVTTVTLDDGVGSIPIPVVPYPADLSTLVVEEKLRGDSDYKELDQPTEYFIDYTGSPVPPMEQPNFGLRDQARLFRTNESSSFTPIDTKYSGQWAIENADGRKTGLLLGSEEVTIGQANDPPYVVEEHLVTAEDITAGGFKLNYRPVSKVAVDVEESSAQSDGLDFEVNDDFLTWKDLQLQEEIYPGVVIRCIYRSAGDPIRLYLYIDYLLEPLSGVITTIKPVTGSLFTVQYIKLTAADVQNKYVVLGAAPVGPVALNVASGPTQSMTSDFRIEGNRVAWDGMGMDLPIMSAGTVLRVLYKSGSGEDPVKYIMKQISMYNCGIQAFRKEGSFDSIDIDDRTTWGTEIFVGKDVQLNELNGGFRFTKQLGASEIVYFLYNAQADQQTEVLDPSLAPAGVFSDALRLETYPIVPYTTSISAFGSANGVRRLVEFVDFVVATDSGVITLITPHKEGEKYEVKYTPTSQAYYSVMLGTGGKYLMRAYEEPCIAMGNTSLTLFNATASSNSLDLGTIRLRTPDGQDIPLTGVRFDAAAKMLHFDANNNLSDQGLYVLDYEFTGKNLPFTPMMRLSKTLKKGYNWLQTDGSVDGSTISAGQVIAVAPYDTTNYQFYRVVNVLNAGGLNRRLVINRPFPADVLEPLIQVSNTTVDFLPLADLTVLPYVSGDTAMIASGDVTESFSIGKMMLVEDTAPNTKSEIYRIVSSSFDGTNTNISVMPPFVTSEARTAVLSWIQVTDTVVYQEGDTTLVTKYPIYPSAFPLWKVDYLPEEGYATIKVSADKVTLTEYNSVGVLVHDVSINKGYKVDDLATDIESAGGGGKFAVSWLFPKGAGTFQDNLEQSQDAFRLPYIVTCYGQVLKKASGTTSYVPLKRGNVRGEGDFQFIGNYVQIETPLVFGDKYIVSYVGINNLSSYRGRALQVTARNLVQLPGKASYRVSCDYYKPDQVYLQTSVENDFLTSVVGPYLEQAEASREGQKPLGSSGVPSQDKPKTSEGGIIDSFYDLRDETLKLSLYKKAYQYYVGRMGYFSEEYKAIAARRLGNCEYSYGTEDPRFNMAKMSDIDNYATFGVAPFNPVGYEGFDPKPDGRFTGVYLSYGEANFFNHDGHGVMISDNAEFTERGIDAGDSIRIDGTSKIYEVSSRVSDQELQFTELIEKKPTESGYVVNSDGVYQQKIEPLFPWFGSEIMKDVPKGGYKYWVIKSSAPDFPLTDADGCVSAVARTAYAEPYALSEDPSYSNILHLQVSKDAGSTWQDSEINLSFLEWPFTAEKVARAIRSGVSVFNPTAASTTPTVIEGLGSLFTVFSERIYTPQGVDSSMTLDTSWPLSLPDKHGRSGSGMGVVMRAKSSGTWFRFTEPVVTGKNIKKTGASSLGFPVDTIFKGCREATSAVSTANDEAAARISEASTVDGVLASYDKMARGISSLYTSKMSAASSKSSAAATTMKASVQSAITAVDGVLVETDATGAISQSHDQAAAMKVKYVSQVTDIDDALASDTSFRQSLQTDPFGFTSTLTQQTMVASEAQAEIDASYLSGDPYFTVQAPAGLVDGRVAWGDRGKQASYAGRSLFPAYVTSTMPVVQRETVPMVYWGDSDPVGPVVLKVLVATGSLVLNAKMTLNDLSLTVSYETNTLSADLPQILLSEKATVADLAAAVTANGGGDFTGVVVHGSDSSLSSSDLAFYGSIPSTSLTKVTAVPVEDGLTARASWYSTGSTAVLKMSSAFTITPMPAVLAPTVDVTATGTTVYSVSLPSGSVTVPFAGSLTMGAYVSALEAALLGYFTVQWDNTQQAYKYGSFVQTTGKALPCSIFYGLKGDVTFYSVSDDNLTEHKAYLTSRGTQLTTAISDYGSRKPEIEVSVGINGEDLYNNMYKWLGYITDKEAGPCVKIPFTKKRLKSSKLLKGMTA